MKYVYAYRWRWLVLLSMVLLVVSVEIPWMCLAPLGRDANIYYRSRWELPVPFSEALSLLYMAVFVVLAIPASLWINRRGVVRTAWLSSILVVLGSVVRFFRFASFEAMVASQLLYAVAQVLVLNLSALTIARWFPIRERGMAMGILSSVQYASLAFVMVFAPLSDLDLSDLLRVYCGVCTAFAVAAAVLIREKPPTPSSFVDHGDQLVAALAHPVALAETHNRSLRGVMLIFAICWGVLMAMLVTVDTVAGSILHIGMGHFVAIFLACGALGAVVIPALSDHFRQRKRWFVISLGGAVPGILLMVFARSEPVAYLGGGVFGFFAFSSLPIGLQYAAELGYPLPEVRIQAYMMLYAQAVGAVILLVAMTDRIMAMEYNLAFFIGLLLACFAGSMFLDESPLIITEDERLDQEINREIVENE